MEQSFSAVSTPPSTDITQLIEALSSPPASFVWSHDRSRLIGTRSGFAIDIWPEKVICAAVMAFDRPKLAQNNAVLMLLILTAMRPDWPEAGDWLAHQMHQAKAARGVYAGPNGEQGLVFEYHQRGATAYLTIARR